VEAIIEKGALKAMVDRLKLAKGQTWVASFRLHDELLEAVSIGSAAVETEAPVDFYEHRDESVSFTIALPELDRWLGGVKDQVTISKDETMVTFSTEDAELPICEVHDGFAVMPALPDEKLSLPANAWNAVESIAWAADKRDQSTHRGTLNIGDGVIWATDMYRAAIVEMDELDADLSFAPGLAGALDFLDPASMEVRTDERGNVHLFNDASRFVIPTFIGTRLQVAHVRKMAQPDVGHDIVTFDRTAILEALKHLKGLQSDKESAVWLTFGERLTLTVITGDSTPTTRQLDYDGAAAIETIAFNLESFTPALGSLVDDEVTMELTSEKAPARMREGSYTALIMPNATKAPAPLARKRK
jgi:hypothetical protein